MSPEVLQDLASDHYPISFQLNSRLQIHKARQAFAFVPDRWPKFRSILNDMVDLSIWPKTVQEVEAATENFMLNTQDALKATFRRKSSTITKKPFPPELRDLLTQKEQSAAALSTEPNSGQLDSQQPRCRTAKLAHKKHYSEEWSATINFKENHRARLFRIARALKRRTDFNIPSLRAPDGPAETDVAKAEA